MNARERVRNRYFLEVKHAIASSVAILDLGTKRASEERHKRESEHYIITTYILQKKKTKKNSWTSDAAFTRASSNFQF